MATISSVCFPVYTSHFTFILITLLVNKGMPPKATAKDISPAPPPKGHFSPFWETRGSFAAMVLDLSYSFRWRSPLPRCRQHSWICPHAAMAAFHSLPYGHKPTESGMKGSGEWCGATTTGRAGLSEPEATLFGKRQSTSPVCLGCGVQTHAWPLFLLSQRDQDQLLASSPTG